ncbi:hypothetical protein I3760_15G034900 [Carya illinoinensis]|nr:hypothetical protein I3760_15G034900 [Carya illinoinensis]
MGEFHRNLSASMRKQWFPWLLNVGMIMGLFMFANVTCDQDHEIGDPPTGAPCISECATCPVICSPPSPQLQSHPPPASSVHHSLPPPKPTPSSPDHSRPRPPTSTPLPSPPAALPPKASSNSLGGSPSPPFIYFNNMPPSDPGHVPPMVGAYGYSYPYYYYASMASTSLSVLDASFFLIMLLVFHFVISCW